MKIALCLSGQPRFIEKGIESLKSNVLHNKNIDIFIHCWYDENNKNIKFDSSQYYLNSKVGSQSEKTKEILYSLNAKKIFLESPKTFHEFNHLIDLPTAKQTKLASMFYSCYQANELKKIYEEENKFKYDLVIKTRTDILYKNKINIFDYLNLELEKYIFAPKIYQEIRMNDSYKTNTGFSYSSLSDTWFMSSSKNIDLCCNIYPNFEEIYKNIYPYAYAEAYLGYISRGINKIPIKMIDLDYQLIRE